MATDRRSDCSETDTRGAKFLPYKKGKQWNHSRNACQCVGHIRRGARGVSGKANFHPDVIVFS